MDSLEEVNRIEEIKNKVLKTLEGCTVAEIQQVAHYIFVNIDKITIYNPIKKVKFQDAIQTEILNRVNKKSSTLTDFSEYPINGVWRIKLQYLFNNILDKEKSYSSKEIINEFCKIEKKKYNDIATPVYKVISYITIGDKVESWIQEVTGKHFGKRYQYKF